MSWATRCPSCATVFRVAEDQLRVSEGFVRCGRCDAVFDARAHLFDLDTGASIRPAAPVPSPVPAPAPPEPDPFEPAPESSGFASTFASTETPHVEPDAADLPHEDAAPAWSQDRFGRTEPGFEDEPLEPAPTALGSSEVSAAEPGAELDPEPDARQAAERMRRLLGATEPDGSPAEAAPTPFASLERSPRPRTGLRTLGWLAVAVLVLALPLQWAWIERDALRAQWPLLETLWQRACGDCEPVTLTRLDGLVVASSSLQPTPQGQAYQLRMRIENRAGHALRLPWVDLQLADGDGRRLLRRSLSPAEMGQHMQRIEPGASLDLQATFRLDGRLAGYEVGLFHP
ncbi:DUF3426 domain-containing protein [Inhella proteolytica]|uniref:DUF3426 domain-containing protein n=1 Tax=Inhella proteolytica TaxID=2795029 RepID=A0A931J4V1_9BURK|nr:DUF3426 domain-containing protein [Inhella proteolytica]MBH9577574.1 DUF3426 domain-containing protein [Inhella proteolytica]